MKQYDVIHSHMRLDLIAAVNASLALGWQLHGDMIAVRTDKYNGMFDAAFDYLQPMVKELTELEVLALKGIVTTTTTVVPHG